MALIGLWSLSFAPTCPLAPRSSRVDLLQDPPGTALHELGLGPTWQWVLFDLHQRHQPPNFRGRAPERNLTATPGH